MRIRRNRIIWISGFLALGLSPALNLFAQGTDTAKSNPYSEDTLRLNTIEKTVPLSPMLSTSQINSIWTGPVFSTVNVVGHSIQLIDVSKKAFHVAEKTGRQLFSEIPGAMIYDMDGSGNQVNMAIRGLDPHRSWEFNIRQNGLVTNSDMYGYPASHYSMPLEAVERIEIIKGTSALQYGAQFGGLINYTLKKASKKKIHYEGQHNLGSFGLLSTYNSLSGTIGKFNYFSYIQYRQSTGFRQNGESKASAFHGSITYKPTSKLSLTAEISNSQYLYHIPGPLGLEQFNTNPRQSTRSRNYFQPNIYIPGITMLYQPNGKTTISFITSAVLGQRNSVLFEGFANKTDTINSLSQHYANRSVDIDHFHSYTSELRLKKQFRIAGVTNNLAAGIRAFNNVLWRRQLGKGTTGSDFDLSIEPNSFKRDLKFHSRSLALSVENAIQINHRWSVSPGFRYEFGNTDAYGNIVYLNTDSIPRTIGHHLPALGLATEYRIKGGHGTSTTPGKHYGTITAGISQAHRPVIFKDIIPGSALERAANDLKDATGYNAEISYFNHIFNYSKYPLISHFDYTLCLFQTQYNNRMGNWVMFDSSNSTNYIQKTNIGNSRTQGFECVLKYNYSNHRKNWVFNITNATAVQYARYTQATAVVDGKNKDISGNFVEGVPMLICRTSINFQHQRYQISMLHSYVSAQFSDALNTVEINSNGSVGRVPSYGLIDAQGVFTINKNCTIKFGINNLLNKRYYTKRPTMYPGPGIWPSDGRGLNLGLSLNF